MVKRRKIIRNAAQCKLCGDVIESKHVHDYVTCECGNISVDGGLEYLRRGFKNPDAVKELSKYEGDEKEEESFPLSFTGIGL